MVKQVKMSSLYCEKCDNKMLIPRKNGKLREQGHMKHMWCFKCKEVRGHLEYVRYNNNLENETYVLKRVKSIKDKGIEFLPEFKNYLNTIGIKEENYIDLDENEMLKELISSKEKLEIFDKYLVGIC